MSEAANAAGRIARFFSVDWTALLVALLLAALARLGGLGGVTW